MTRPLTKAQLSRLASPIGRQRRQDPLVRFLLRTNLFGLFSLISRQSDAVAIAASFVAGGVMFFTPLTLAVAVGCAGRAKQPKACAKQL